MRRERARGTVMSRRDQRSSELMRNLPWGFSPAHACACACTLVAVLGCERASGRYDHADRPEPAPQIVGEVPKIEDDGASRSVTMSADAAAECGRGTGRNPDGECVGLGLLELAGVQQVQIPAGEFVMGDIPSTYDARLTRETPAVRRSGQPPRYARVESFWIDLHEVSRGAYAECVSAGKCSPTACPEGAPDPVAELSQEIASMYPQTCVTHEQAANYCAVHGGRLPTEAEWEYASRGPDARFYPWGNEIMDELPRGLYPVGRMRDDMSYFGILGMGTNAVEWVADLYDPDAGLRSFLTGEFREPEGPVATTRAAWEKALACGDPAAKGCEADEAARERFVVKVSRAGARRAARARLPEHPPEASLEGWAEIAEHPNLGFRCAADLTPGRDTPLRVPAATAVIPLTRSEGTLELFGGVAEAVTMSEAQRFCELLTVGPEETALTDWRLPTQAEVERIAEVFRGPGPFWTQDGPIVQDDGTAYPTADAPWVALDVDDAESTALLARCVRGSTGAAE